MSVFMKPRLARIISPKWTSIRTVMSNPALNTNPAFRNAAIIPFGINFLEDDLRSKLESRGVDCDELERIYYHQCQDDAEFNAPRLPRSYDSKLWGFIYGQRLVSAAYQLATIREDEQYLVNYLNETIKELTMRMNRFYPTFDYKSQINACKLENEIENNNTYNEAYNETLAQIIASDPINFISIFKNNGFIPYDSPSDSDDKFNDYLPENIENELVAQYKYNWDCNSNLNIGFEGYYNRIQKLENIFAPKIDSLSKNIRKNFADFLLNNFNNNNIGNIEYVINMVSNTTNVIISNGLNDLNSDELVRNCINLLDEMSTSGVLLGKLFYGNSQCENELNGQSNEELINILQSCDKNRLILVNKSLEIYEYLKYNSITRLILTCLINDNNFKEYFGQYLNDNTGDDNIDNFSDLNNDSLDKIISYQSIYYENQEDLYNSYVSLNKAIENKCNNNIILDLNAFDAPPCYINDILETNYNTAKENGNVVDQIKYLTYKKYVNNNGGNIAGIQLIKALMNGGKNGITGDEMNAIAYKFSTDSSGAQEILSEQIFNYMNCNALINGNNVNTFKSDLITGVQSELDNIRNISNKYNESRNNLENAIKEISFDFQTINFDYAKTNYDPLNMYLSQFRYYNKK